MDYELSTAHRIADELIEHLRPVCTQIEIAGSIRRRAGGAMPDHLRQRDGALWEGDTLWDRQVARSSP